jgi:hypothetical protein
VNLNFIVLEVVDLEPCFSTSSWSGTVWLGPLSVL